jgi:hypothetical protein
MAMLRQSGMRSVFEMPLGTTLRRVMEGIAWADLDADEQRAIAMSRTIYRAV